MSSDQKNSDIFLGSCNIRVSVHYTEGIGAPSKPIRLMVGLLILKQLENLSDEAVVLQWKRNPYYQAFCGMQEFQRKLPCHSTELVHFRKRIGTEGVELLSVYSG